ncbi:MAG: GAF domain-containing protein [Desulfobacteraceae bacterium]|nr:MAG: GAF domain-containing protein [Desulfobacteraceae bacterium]
MAVLPKKASDTDLREKSLEEQLEYQKNLNSIANRIHSANDTNEILLNLQAEILSLFDADRITIYVVDGAKKQIVSRVKTGNEINEIRVPVDKQSIAGYCAASGKMVNVINVCDEEELKVINHKLKFDKSWDQKTGYKTTQMLAAPITHNRYLLGVIQLINKKTGEAFTEEDQSSALDIAKVLGVAFFKNQKVAQKAKATKFDFLLTNNIISSKDLTEAISRARKSSTSVASVLMKDFHASKDSIGKCLSSFYKTRFIPYDDKMVIPGELLNGLRVSYLKHNVFVPVSKSGDKVVVAMEDPNYLPARDAIKRLIPAKKIEYCVSLKEDIFDMINLFFDVKRTEMLEDAGTIEDILGQLASDDEEYDDEINGITEEDSAIVQIVNKMIVDISTVTLRISISNHARERPMP